MYHKPLAYGVRADGIKKIAKNNPNLNVTEVKQELTKVLNATNNRVRKELRKWINSKVPKMTGRLRRDLIRHLMTSYVSNCVIRVYVQTNVDYAKRVNAFETHNVRHRGKKIKYRGRTIILHDYKAIGHFFDEMVKIAIKLILYHLDRQKRRHASSKKLKYKEMKIIKLW